jgi:hypothetical protein
VGGAEEERIQLKKLRDARPEIFPTIKIAIRDVESLAIALIVRGRPDHGFGENFGVCHLHDGVITLG